MQQTKDNMRSDMKRMVLSILLSACLVLSGLVGISAAEAVDFRVSARTGDEAVSPEDGGNPALDGKFQTPEPGNGTPDGEISSDDGEIPVLGGEGTEIEPSGKAGDEEASPNTGAERTIQELEERRSVVSSIRQASLGKETLLRVMGEEGWENQDMPSQEVTNIEGFAAAFKDNMIHRVSPFELVVQATISTEQDMDDLDELIARVIDVDVLAHTGKPCEGDYLRYQRGGIIPRSELKSIDVNNDGTRTVTLSCKYNLAYYSTAEEEKAVTERLGEVMGDLDLSGKSNYDKVKAIHDFICRNVTYDKEHLGVEDYVHQFSAYGALIDGTSVDQGYANLFYRMCLEAGIDARIIEGEAENEEEGGLHVWNIVRIGGQYYYVDVTWDDTDQLENPIRYDYFLVGENKIGFDHFKAEEFKDPAFANAYPTSATDYERSYYDDFSDDEPSFVKASLLLEGQIGVNFFMKLPKIPGCDYEDSYVEFTVNGDTEHTETVGYDSSKRSQDQRLFGFTCHVNPVQMADPIQAVFHYWVNGAEETIDLDGYTVEDYIVSLENDEGISPAAVELAHALANFGYHSQRYVSELLRWTLGGENGDHVPVTSNLVDDYSDASVQEIINALPLNEIVVKQSSDIKSLTFSIALDSETSMYVYLSPQEGYSGSFTAKINDGDAHAIAPRGGRYRVVVSGIGADMLGEPYTITVTTDAGVTELQLCALDYVGLSLRRSQNQLEKNAMASIYKYYDAAQAYQSTISSS